MNESKCKYAYEILEVVESDPNFSILVKSSEYLFLYENVQSEFVNDGISVTYILSIKMFNTSMALVEVETNEEILEMSRDIIDDIFLNFINTYSGE